KRGDRWYSPLGHHHRDRAFPNPFRPTGCRGHRDIAARRNPRETALAYPSHAPLASAPYLQGPCPSSFLRRSGLAHVAVVHGFVFIAMTLVHLLHLFVVAPLHLRALGRLPCQRIGRSSDLVLLWSRTAFAFVHVALVRRILIGIRCSGAAHRLLG